MTSAIGSSPRAEPCAQRFAVDERHRVSTGSPSISPTDEQRHDVRVLEPRRERDLALESRDRDAAGELRRQQLHDDAPSEREVLGHEHARHAAAAELRPETIIVAEGRLKLVAKVRHADALCTIRSMFIALRCRR